MSNRISGHTRRAIVVAVAPTGAEPMWHSAAEIAAIDLDTQQQWHLAVPLTGAQTDIADSSFLERSDYYARRVPERARRTAASFPRELTTLATTLRGNTVAGCFPELAATHLASLFYRFDLLPSWHHRMADIGTLTAGAWGIAATEIPSLSMCCRLWRVPTDDLHTPLGEATAVAKCFRALAQHSAKGVSGDHGPSDVGPPRRGVMTRHTVRSAPHPTRPATSRKSDPARAAAGTQSGPGRE